MKQGARIAASFSIAGRSWAKPGVRAELYAQLSCWLRGSKPSSRSELAPEAGLQIVRRSIDSYYTVFHVTAPIPAATTRSASS